VAEWWSRSQALRDADEIVASMIGAED
jgi:hypothetical protein